LSDPADNQTDPKTHNRTSHVVSFGGGKTEEILGGVQATADSYTWATK